MMKINTYSLSGADRDLLLKYFNTLKYDPYCEYEQLRLRFRADVDGMVPNLRSLLLAKENYGYLYIRNLPIDERPSLTPPKGRRPENKLTNISEYTIIFLSVLMDCEQLVYQDEKDGEGIHQVCPVQGRESSCSNEGSCFFDFHIEVPHVKNPPNYLILYAVKGDANARTSLFEIDRHWSSFPTDIKRHMREREFSLRWGESFCSENREIVSIVEFDSDGRRFFRVDLEEMEPLSSGAEKALQFLKEYSRKHAEYVTLVSGDCIIINNRKVLHGRQAFVASNDGNQRWLQRMYLRAPLVRG